MLEMELVPHFSIQKLYVEEYWKKCQHEVDTPLTANDELLRLKNFDYELILMTDTPQQPAGS